LFVAVAVTIAVTYCASMSTFIQKKASLDKVFVVP